MKDFKMTDLALKALNDNLWRTADVLRSGAHLATNKYGQPILELIFLRYAYILFKQHREEIDAEYERLSGTRIVIHLKPSSINNAKILVPKSEIINGFVCIAKSIIMQIDSLNDQIDMIIGQRDLLLPCLMSGKLEV